jgi:uncharacterized phiE125 gp8 family phage protein
MTLAANALTTLAGAKGYLKIPLDDTDQDGVIEFLINAVSSQIEAYCKRKLKEQVYTDEEFDGNDFNTLLLPAYPVTAVSSVKIDDEVVVSSEYKVRKSRGALVRLKSCWPCGILNLKVSYTAGFAEIPPDLELACKHTVMFYYKTDVADFSRTYGEGFVLRPDALPPQTKMLCGPYRRVLI